MSHSTARACIVAGGVLGGCAVAAGAFGAHGLEARLEAFGRTAEWETASRYALVHAVALVVTGLAAALPGAEAGRVALRGAAWCFGLGALVFSGSLGTLAATNTPRLGAVVPIGGGLLVVAWVLLAVGGWRLRTGG